MMGTIRL